MVKLVNQSIKKWWPKDFQGINFTKVGNGVILPSMTGILIKWVNNKPYGIRLMTIP